jgi:hypothetical protein
MAVAGRRRSAFDAQINDPGALDTTIEWNMDGTVVTGTLTRFAFAGLRRLSIFSATWVAWYFQPFWPAICRLCITRGRHRSTVDCVCNAKPWRPCGAPRNDYERSARFAYRSPTSPAPRLATTVLEPGSVVTIDFNAADQGLLY